MDSRLIDVLGRITNRDEAGRHFTEVYSTEDLDDLEAECLVTINRPIHDATGISYSQESWSIELTDAGLAYFD